MSNDGKKSDIGFLGESFQFELVHEFFDNREFFEELSVIVDQNMFTDPTLKVIVGVMKNHLDKYGVAPRYDTMSTELRQMARSEKDCEFYLSVLEKIKNTSTNNVERLQELGLKFFRQQNIIRVAHEILKIAGDGDTAKYDECVSLLNEALTKGLHNDFGESPLSHLDETLSEDYREAIPTGIKEVDRVLEGGLGKGELGVIIAPSGIGKTSLTTAMASYAATYPCPQNAQQGYKVLQIVFEDRIKQIQRKHIARICGIEAKDLSKPEFVNIVKDTVKKYEGKEMLDRNLRIVRFPSGEKTAQSIKRFIKTMTNNGFRPDLVIIDYFECLAHEPDRNASNEYEKEGKTMRAFEAMVGELNIAMWIPSQGTKDSINLDLVTMDKIGGSAKKTQIAHIIMSIAKTMADMNENKATIAILKNRAGKSGEVFGNVNFNNGTCIIDTDGSDTFDSPYALKQKSDSVLLNMQRDIVNEHLAKDSG